MELSAEQLAQIRSQLTADGGQTLISTLAVWGKEGSKIARNSDVFRQSAEAGWIDEAGGLTPLGQSLADACRELLFWRDRKGVLAWESLGEPLAQVDYAGKRVVEIGSGMGVNLTTLQKRGADVIGVEPVAAYQQIGATLWEAEGEAPVEITVAPGEATGLAGGEADIVLCISSLQYCEIDALIAEIARLLKPGGQLVIYGDSFSEYLRHIWRARRAGPKEAVTLANSVTYSLMQRRIFAAKGALSTTRPVYPVYTRLKAWLRAAGFGSVTRKSVQGECLVLAVKA